MMSPWWAHFTLPQDVVGRVARPSSSQCPSERRLRQIAFNKPWKYDKLSVARGTRDGKMCSDENPWVGQTEAGDWCCFSTQDTALHYPHSEAAADMQRRFAEFKDATSLQRANKSNKPSRKDWHNCGQYIQRICRRGDTLNDCCTKAYPCYDKNGKRCYEQAQYDEDGKEEPFRRWVMPAHLTSSPSSFLGILRQSLKRKKHRGRKISWK
jgi:hypothetical protein